MLCFGPVSSLHLVFQSFLNFIILGDSVWLCLLILWFRGSACFVLVVIDASNGKETGFGSVLTDLKVIKGSREEDTGGEEGLR